MYASEIKAIGTIDFHFKDVDKVFNFVVLDEVAIVTVTDDGAVYVPLM